MQFEKTLTCRNLAASFAGECQAGMRYQMIARAAMQQGCEELAGTIKTIAKNETVHARKFFEVLTKHGGTDMDNIEICSGYPFHTGDIGRALRLAAGDERAEHRKIYPAFAETAASEGFDDAAALFALVANVEKRHEQIFEYLAEAFEKGALYKNDSPLLYVCAECGHMQTAKSAWERCPLCGAGQGEVYLHIPYQKEKL